MDCRAGGRRRHGTRKTIEKDKHAGGALLVGGRGDLRSRFWRVPLDATRHTDFGLSDNNRDPFNSAPTRCCARPRAQAVPCHAHTHTLITRTRVHTHDRDKPCPLRAPHHAHRLWPLCLESLGRLGMLGIGPQTAVRAGKGKCFSAKRMVCAAAAAAFKPPPTHLAAPNRAAPHILGDSSRRNRPVLNPGRASDHTKGRNRLHSTSQQV